MKKNLVIIICVLSAVTVGLGALFIKENNRHSLKISQWETSMIIGIIPQGRKRLKKAVE